MQNRQLIFSPRKPYDLVADPALDAGEATASCLQFPVWWSILKVVRTHFAPPGRGEGLAKNSEPKF